MEYGFLLFKLFLMIISAITSTIFNLIYVLDRICQFFLAYHFWSAGVQWFYLLYSSTLTCWKGIVQLFGDSLFSLSPHLPWNFHAATVFVLYYNKMLNELVLFIPGFKILLLCDFFSQISVIVILSLILLLLIL